MHNPSSHPLQIRLDALCLHIEGYGQLRQLLCGWFTICGVLQSIHKLGTRVAQLNNPNDKPTQITFKIIGSLILRL